VIHPPDTQYILPGLVKTEDIKNTSPETLVFELFMLSMGNAIGVKNFENF
jgi:hypothetical protein